MSDPQDTGLAGLRAWSAELQAELDAMQIGAGSDHAADAAALDLLIARAARRAAALRQACGLLDELETQLLRACALRHALADESAGTAP